MAAAMSPKLQQQIKQMLTDTLCHNRRQQILILELQPFKRQTRL